MRAGGAPALPGMLALRFALWVPRTRVPSLWVLALLAVGCTCSGEDEGPPGRVTTGASAVPAPTVTDAPPPRVLFVPDAAVVAATGTPPPAEQRGTVCPADMVSVRGQFCVDRYESVLVETDQARDVSPYYHPTFFQTKSAYNTWEKLRHDFGTPEVQLLPVPQPPSFQLEGAFEVRAVVRRGAIPN